MAFPAGRLTDSYFEAGSAAAVTRLVWQFSNALQPLLARLAGATFLPSLRTHQVMRCRISQQTCHLFPTSHSERCLAGKKKRNSGHHLCGCSLVQNLQLMLVPPANIRILLNVRRNTKQGKERSNPNDTRTSEAQPPGWWPQSALLKHTITWVF